MKMNNGTRILVDVIAEQKQKQAEATLWGGSTYEEIDGLKCDHSGCAGEKLTHRLCNQLGIPNEYDENVVNQDDGTYDVIVKGRLVEVKTARVGSDGDSWQHESLRDHGCDYFWFNDILPNGYFITIIPSNFNFQQKHPILGRTPHLRKETSGTYKFDFGRITLKKGIDAGVTIFVDNNTDDKEIRDFINRIIV